ncbi:hypothetical protein [Lachnoanaerobaculum saburreum]|uniref:Bacterial type II secretion system protein F domain protein n=1 Tax=Lachnoanaerobaculum saburreum TaxID=467210 RepID=A0A133ZPX5_9FIRM|nr:hypothetical protein [Lachnoanaerobaculum saburreum]KXB57507.1 hypothetical protein HMPREF1866_01388 [Lachnoanaerobaculum saburreum]
MKKYLKQIFSDKLKYWLIVTAGFILFILCSTFLNNTELSNYIQRPYVDEDDTEVKIEVEGLLEGSQKIEIPVSKRVYSNEEVKEAMKKGMDEILKILPGENTSLQDITTDLNPVSELSDLGLGVKWDFGDSDIIDIQGKVDNENLGESVDIDIGVTLSYESYEESYVIPARVMPKPLTADESLIKRFKDYISVADKKSAGESGFYLPESFEGKKLVYHLEDGMNFHLIWIMGIIVAILLYLREKNNDRQKLEKKKRELLKDYPDIVSKLIVFIGAGLSVRQSWEGIVKDYESENKEKRYAYEEMAKSLARLKTGTQENVVYKEFGRSCLLRQYMKLASLLEQNRKSGISTLSTLLGMESQSAWEERLNLAKREGEELNTKLLLPLFMMLLIVMMMIIVPALLIFY